MKTNQETKNYLLFLRSSAYELGFVNFRALEMATANAASIMILTSFYKKYIESGNEWTPISVGGFDDTLF